MGGQFPLEIVTTAVLGPLKALRLEESIDTVIIILTPNETFMGFTIIKKLYIDLLLIVYVCVCVHVFVGIHLCEGPCDQKSTLDVFLH